MRLQAGQAAPDFAHEDLAGRPLRLEDFRGRKLLLSFYRYASCPFCNLRVHDLAARAADFQAQGLSLVAVFQSPAASMARYVGRQAPPFPLLADPEHRLYQLYGVEQSLGAFLKSFLRAGRFARALARGFLPGKIENAVTLVPADFLIGSDLVVREAFYGRDISDHVPLERVAAFARE